jgi:hypothetical protein
MNVLVGIVVNGKTIRKIWFQLHEQEDANAFARRIFEHALVVEALSSRTLEAMRLEVDGGEIPGNAQASAFVKSKAQVNLHLDLQKPPSRFCLPCGFGRLSCAQEFSPCLS